MHRQLHRSPPYSSWGSKYISILASNITQYGPQAQGFIDETEHDVMLLSERRKRGAAYPGMVKSLGRSGWRTVGIEASETAKGDSSGGALICFRSHLLVTKFVNLGSGPEEHRGSRWALAHLRLKGASVVLGAAYLCTGIEASGENLEVLGQLGEALSAIGLPFLIGADWNMEPVALAETGWLGRLRAAVVRLPGVQVTCSSGNKGRLLDYFVCSQELLPLIGGGGQDLGTPWKPHAGVYIRLSARPRSVSMLKHITPKEIPGPLPPESRSACSWEGCMAEAQLLLSKGSVGGSCPDILKEHLAVHPRGKEAFELGDKLGLWAFTMELYLVAQAGLVGKQALPYLGRGQYPKLRQVPALSKEVPAKDNGGGGALWWGAVSSRLSELSLVVSDESRKRAPIHPCRLADCQGRPCP